MDVGSYDLLLGDTVHHQQPPSTSLLAGYRPFPTRAIPHGLFPSSSTPPPPISSGHPAIDLCVDVYLLLILICCCYITSYTEQYSLQSVGCEVIPKC